MRNRLINLLRKYMSKPFTYEGVADKLLKEGVTFEKQGEWIGWHGDRKVGEDEYGMDIYRHYHYFSCRKCGRRTVVKENYCPNCGSRMMPKE